MKHPNVAQAFDLLLAELETALRTVREQAAAASREGRYAEAQAHLAAAQRIDRFVSDIRSKKREWKDLGTSSGRQRKAAGPRLARGERTPEESFRLPILRALETLGGQAPMSRVLERVYAEMKPHLKPADLRSLRSDAKTPRWRNTAQWTRQSLLDEGLLRDDSPRGVRAISEKRKTYLADYGG